MADQADVLFLNTLRDLERRISEKDPYELLGASALIRKLFLDTHPLVDQVNRRYRIKIAFEITEPPGLTPGLPPPTCTFVQDGIDPDTAPPFRPRVQVDRDQFFRTVLATINSRQYILRDIVLFEANVMGGIHAGSAKGDKEKALQQLTISFGGYRASLRQLQAIGRVILKALAPLKAEVERATST